MRFFLFLAFALIPSLDAQHPLGDVSHFIMPGGLPNGAILTFYFKHTGNDDYPEPVSINFYDQPTIEIDKVYDITAHLRIERHDEKPVYSRSYINYEWTEQTVKEQPLDEEPPSDGWWRVDIYKHDNFNMNVFFQGFWSDIRTFAKSLAGLHCAYVMPDHVDHSTMQVRVKIPLNYVPPMSVAQFKANLESERFDTGLSFPRIPIGATIEMTVVLRASGGAKYKTPSLIFVPKDGTDFFLTMNQKWYWDRQRTYLGDSKGVTLCTEEKPNGDLQHVRLERISQNIVELRIFYKPSTGTPGVVCQHTFADEYAAAMDRPFAIASRDGATILHLEHTITRSIELEPDH